MNRTEKTIMADHTAAVLDRRELLTRVAPACAIACLAPCRVATLAASTPMLPLQDSHKFDVPSDVSMSIRQRMIMQFGRLIRFIRSLQGQLGETETIRLLNVYSADIGRRAGEQQALNAPDTSFESFVQVFRPPNFADSLTHEVVEDSEKVFGLRVTECIWAETFQGAGMGGEIGHAAVCNMDYHWPPAFNPDFKMERTKTLMQGHDHCNHRYIDTA
jgi:hypothetical protein